MDLNGQYWAVQKVVVSEGFIFTKKMEKIANKELTHASINIYKSWQILANRKNGEKSRKKCPDEGKIRGMKKGVKGGVEM